MSTIRCAHCKGYHESIALVKVCAVSHNAAKAFTEPVPPARPAYVALREQAAARAKIDKMVVPDGYYALQFGDTVRFYRVVTKAGGRWDGRTFVDQQVSDDFIPTYSVTQRLAVLDRIAQDVRGASIRYGHEIGRCGVCGRTLTNAASRDAGIGPICAERRGW